MSALGDMQTCATQKLMSAKGQYWTSLSLQKSAFSLIVQRPFESRVTIGLFDRVFVAGRGLVVF
jgi:hypothetical protein